MEATLLDLLGLVIRWLHVITGIAWIGASFYFIWLDNSLEPPPAWKAEQGIKGDLWAFHGGGVYEVAKYAAAPPAMPKTLHWFYWEAYSTWITGMLLLLVVYYIKADSFLVSGDSPVQGSAATVGASLLCIALAVGFYELLIRSGLAARGGLLLSLSFVALCGYCYGLTVLFSDRAAYIHLGIALGSIMVGNVFLGIIPAQRGFVRQIEAGEEPDTAPLAEAKLRSTHNNYMTLPVLFCMISNHYPLLYGHRYNWLILVAVVLITGTARKYFNLRHQGIQKPGILVGCASAFAALMLALALDARPHAAPDAAVPDDSVALALVAQHCTVCHAENPSHPAFAAAPGGMILENRADVAALADRAVVAVSSNYMPLANMTGMTDEQRQGLVAWLRTLQ
ncbi:MAG: urate hydroxylase PuuD [Halieaceae bacterium]|jgi:uncharacterized membrane protein|nr:urate hydroxylase PuuD [Halieaceae bacterium]